MARHIGTDTVTIVRAATKQDTHGNTVPDWTTTVTHDLTNCYVEDGETREELVNRDEILLTKIVFAPTGSDVLSTDRATFGGVTYEVDGQPKTHRSYSGKLDYLGFNLVEWTG